MRAYAGALLGGRMPTAALRASMARSAFGSLRDRQSIQLGEEHPCKPVAGPSSASLARERGRSRRAATPPRSRPPLRPRAELGFR